MDGIIIINKEKDYTSNDVVQIVKKIFKEKVGHTGTLDPMATGVLPILIGKGTLLSKYLINHDKIYVATVKLGIKTDTGDVTGNIIQEKKVTQDTFNEENVLKVLENIKGKQEQLPPMYSAIKVKGKKLYEYARKGQEIKVKPRKIEIYDTKLLSISKEKKEIKFKVSCSKGTYIRTLCEKIGENLGAIGTMSELKREKVGEFEIKKSVFIGELKENCENEKFIEQHLISIENFFINKKEIILSPRSFVAFINGVKLLADEEDEVYRIYDINKKFVGIRNGKKWNFEKRYCNLISNLIK